MSDKKEKIEVKFCESSKNYGYGQAAVTIGLGGAIIIAAYMAQLYGLGETLSWVDWVCLGVMMMWIVIGARYLHITKVTRAYEMKAEEILQRQEQRICGRCVRHAGMCYCPEAKKYKTRVAGDEKACLYFD